MALHLSIEQTWELRKPLSRASGTRFSIPAAGEVGPREQRRRKCRCGASGLRGPRLLVPRGAASALSAAQLAPGAGRPGSTEPPVSTGTTSPWSPRCAGKRRGRGLGAEGRGSGAGGWGLRAGGHPHRDWRALSRERRHLCRGCSNEPCGSKRLPHHGGRLSPAKREPPRGRLRAFPGRAA